MDKVYSRIIWQNEPSTATALGATNLNRMDVALNTIDDRVVGMDTSKANQSTVNTVVQSITYNESTGVMTITKVNGTSTTIDTKLEKLAVNFSYNPTTQQLDITLDDGTVQHVDLSALITQYEFMDTDTVSFSVQPDGKIKASIIPGSITGSMLQPNYLADIIVQANIATTQAGVATNAAEDAMEYRDEALAAKTAAETARDQAVDISNVGIASEEHIGLVKGNGNVAVNADASMWADPYKDKATLTGSSVQFTTADDALIAINPLKTKTIATKATLVFTATTITTTGVDFTGFSVGDSVTIAGCSVTANNKTAVITAVAAKVLTFASGTFTAATETGDVTITKGTTVYSTAISPGNPQKFQSTGDSGSFVVGVAGKNLIPKTSKSAQTINGVTFTPNTDGSITINGTATANADFYLFGSYGISAPIAIAFNPGAYAEKGTGNPSVSMHLGRNGTSPTVWANYENNAMKTFASADYITWCMLRINSGATINNLIVYPQIELGSTATPYEPYKGNTLTVNATGYSLPDGTCDIIDVAGRKKTMNIVAGVIDGTKTPNDFDSSMSNCIRFSYPNILTGSKSEAALSNSNTRNTSGLRYSYDQADNEHWYCINGYAVITMLKSRFASLDNAGIKGYFTEKPMTILAPLATPVTTDITVTPTNYLTSYKGITNVFTLDATQPEFTAIAKSELWSRDYLQDVRIADTKDSKVSFTQAATLANVASGETHSTLWSKVSKFFSFIGTTALTTTAQTISAAINELVTKKADKSNTYNFDYNLFASGTILSWAASVDKPTVKGIAGGFIPSDIPVSAEGYSEVVFIDSGARRRVNFITYASSTRIVYSRDIFNGAWYNSWVYNLDSTTLINTDTVNDANKPLAANVGYALGQEIDALSTASTPASLTLAISGAVGTVDYVRNGKTVQVSINTLQPVGQNIASYSSLLLGTLPTGYRPLVAVYGVPVFLHNINAALLLTIGTNGEVRLATLDTAVTFASGNAVRGGCSFIVA